MIEPRAKTVLLGNPETVEASMAAGRTSESAGRLPTPADAALLGVVLERHPMGLALLDTQLCFRWVNARLAAITGLEPSAHVGRRLDELLPDVPPDVVEALSDTLLTGATASHEVACATGDAGEVATWRITLEAVVGEDGVVEDVVATAEDVTLARLERAALDQERADAAVMAAITRDVLGETGPERIAEIVLQVASASLGAPSGAVFLLDSESDQLRLAAAHGVSAWSATRLHELTLAIEDGGQPVAHSADPVVRRPARRTAHSPEPPALLEAPAEVLVPLRTPDGPIGVFVLGLDRDPSSDIVARIRTFANVAAASVARAQASMSDRRARALLEAVIDQMPLGVAVTGPDGELDSMNQALEAIWRGRHLSASIADYGMWRGFHLDGRLYAPTDWPLARSLNEREVVVAEEILIERFDGTRGVISLSSSPVTDAEGSIIAAVAVVEDVSHRRHAEAAREAFLGVLAHELRTPLTTVLGSARILERSGQPAALVAELAADISAEALRMARVIDDLLVVSRVERGIALAVDAPVLVQRILPAVVAAEQRAWPAVLFDLHVEPWLPPVRGDDSMLDQVVRNLLSNAAKYGGGHVTVSAEPCEGGVAIRVADDGPGIAPGEGEHIFDLFFRSTRTQRVAPGAGIGLFVVRNLVEAMGGSVAAEPAASGSQFVVRLPAYATPDASEDPASSRPVQGRADPEG